MRGRVIDGGGAVHSYRTIGVVVALAGVSCVSTTVYRSSGPAERGEVAVASDVELAHEVDFGTWTLGVFSSKERSQIVRQNVLFAARTGGTKASDPGRVTAYDLSRTASISLDQARRLLVAVDTFLELDPKSLGPSKLFNFELSAGPIDATVGAPDHHPFLEITFSVIFSVAEVGKYFALTLPGMNRERLSWTVTLEPDDVKLLRRGISEAIALAAK